MAGQELPPYLVVKLQVPARQLVGAATPALQNLPMGHGCLKPVEPPGQ